MAETLTLTTPITPPALVSWDFDSLYMSRSAQTVTATYLSSTNQIVTATETGPGAVTLMSQMNKANFSGGNKSLRRIALEWGVTKGVLGPGTVSGTPD